MKIATSFFIFKKIKNKPFFKIVKKWITLRPTHYKGTQWVWLSQWVDNSEAMPRCFHKSSFPHIEVLLLFLYRTLIFVFNHVLLHVDCLLLLTYFLLIYVCFYFVLTFALWLIVTFPFVGLSEVLFGLGFERLEQLIPDVISATEKTDLAAHVKEGYLMLFLYLPSTFGTEFTPFIGAIIPSILKVCKKNNILYDLMYEILPLISVRSFFISGLAL